MKREKVIIKITQNDLVGDNTKTNYSYFDFNCDFIVNEIILELNDTSNINLFEDSIVYIEETNKLNAVFNNYKFNLEESRFIYIRHENTLYKNERLVENTKRRYYFSFGENLNDIEFSIKINIIKHLN